jgi:hypothetical protein
MLSAYLLGLWQCDHGFSSGSASVDYPSTPTGFDDKWFAGADTFRLDAFEVGPCLAVPQTPFWFLFHWLSSFLGVLQP